MYVTIHGHFYQPPRENPWTGEVQRQESAAPHHDWNDRITDECYGPNGRSRVLDSQGRIVAIVNNFSHLSFNFGPTLLADLERRHPRVYRRILEADRESVLQHGGHGNAIAQAYNHMILPLANRRDKRTQVRWGLRDFRHRFGRPSEGLWLPETAIDAETLQVAVEEGVRYLVLAPHQAARMRRVGENRWVDAGVGIDPTRAYRCFTDSSRRRSIDCFFYDGAISAAVSFEHLLRDAGGFAGRLEAAGRGKPANALVHVATDGEVYGHHEPFADMCLAYLFTVEGPRRGMRFVNYAEHLDLAPPEFEVFLDFGENGEGTAWSCAHGVGRWARDCGCETGGRPGWNQRWRTPLRRALDAVRDQIQDAYVSLASRHFADAWAARDDYIEVLLRPDGETRQAFLERHLRAPVEEDTRRMLWSMLEATRQSMLMYTSCAWFFADVSGLEVQQNLAYAARACELAQPYVSEPLEALLLLHLEQARSNLPGWRHGAAVHRRTVQPRRVGPEHAAAQAALEAAALDRPLDRRVFAYAVSGRVHRPSSGGRRGARAELELALPGDAGNARGA
jgi:alpha-amylase/alpha-mannosidase (GH57 family)